MVTIPFIILSVLLFFYSKKMYAGKLNPLSVYTVTFTGMILLFDLHLILYDPLSIECGIVLIVGELIFFFGCLQGKRTRVVLKRSRRENDSTETAYNETKLKKELYKWIIITSGLASIAILSGFILLLRDYGYSIVRVLASGAAVYADRMAGRKNYIFIPYLSSFAYNGMIFAGIYLKRYGFRIFVIVPLILIGLVTLCTGNRYMVILAIIEFFTAFVLSDTKRERSSKFRKLPLWKKLLFVLPIAGLLFVFWKVTVARSSFITVNSYVSPTLASMMAKYGNGVYKIYAYAATPVGVLNAFLKDPYFHIGHSTFGLFYNILERLGIITENARVGRDYYVPIDANTGTYLKNLIADFSVLAPISVFIWGFVCSQVYEKVSKRQTITALSVYSVLMSVLAYCFFTWYFAETSTWICIVISIIVGGIIDRRCRTGDEESIGALY